MARKQILLVVAVAGPIIVSSHVAAASPVDSTQTRLGIDIEQVRSTELVSAFARGGVPRSRWSSDAEVSADGRHVVFLSKARLVRGIGWTRTDPQPHTYVRNLATGTTTAVDVTPEGRLGTLGDDRWGPGWLPPSISADGRLVAFQSQAEDLTPGDTNDSIDVFVRDMVLGQTTMISVDPSGGPANGTSFSPSISGDGSTVVFSSRATNLVPGDPSDWWDVFRHDLATGKTTLVSQTPGGGFPNSISDEPSASHDGSRIAFTTRATDIVDGGYVPDGGSVVVYDVSTDTSILVSRGLHGERPDGRSGEPAISANGTTVVYTSQASNIAPNGYELGEDVFAFDLETEQNIVVPRADDGSPPDGQSFDGDINASGTMITFEAGTSNLGRDDDNSEWDVFVFDRTTGRTRLVARSFDGDAANGTSDNPSISADGSVVAYVSDASDLFPGPRTRLDRIYATSFG